MDINQNIEQLSKRLSEIDTESKRIQGALDVLNTLKGMGVKIINPEKNLENVAEDEVLDEQPAAIPEENST
jgi:hypothetical protein